MGDNLIRLKYSIFEVNERLISTRDQKRIRKKQQKKTLKTMLHNAPAAVAV